MTLGQKSAFLTLARFILLDTTFMNSFSFESDPFSMGSIK
jgi:hypothetical protein